MGQRNKPQIGDLERLGCPINSGIFEKICDHFFHSMNTTDKKVDEFVCVIVQTPLVSSMDQLGIAGDIAKRLLNIV